MRFREMWKHGYKYHAVQGQGSRERTWARRESFPRVPLEAGRVGNSRLRRESRPERVIFVRAVTLERNV